MDLLDVLIESAMIALLLFFVAVAFVEWRETRLP